MNAKRLAVKTGRSSPDLQDQRADAGEPEVGGAYNVGKYIGGVSLWVDLSASMNATPLSTCKAFHIDVADPHLDSGTGL